MSFCAISFVEKSTDNFWNFFLELHKCIHFAKWPIYSCMVESTPCEQLCTMAEGSRCNFRVLRTSIVIQFGKVVTWNSMSVTREKKERKNINADTSKQLAYFRHILILICQKGTLPSKYEIYIQTNAELLCSMLKNIEACQTKNKQHDKAFSSVFSISHFPTIFNTCLCFFQYFSYPKK